MSLKSKIAIVAFLILTAIIFLLRPYYLFVTQTLKVSPLKTLFCNRSGLVKGNYEESK